DRFRGHWPDSEVCHTARRRQQPRRQVHDSSFRSLGGLRMAARSGAGTGVVVSLVVFIICTVALLVFTIVFYARANEAMEGESRARQDLEAIADAQVRQRDDVQAMRAEAGSRSLLTHMLNQRQQLLSKVTGNPDTRVDQVANEFRAFGVGENES